MYTSGCPKNQNRCWYRIGSPPPLESKKVVFRFRSVRSIVIAPARTGRDRRRSRAVRIIDHGKRGVLSLFCFLFRMFTIVEMKLAAPKIDLAPARCKEKMAMSTGGPLWAVAAANGG